MSDQKLEMPPSETPHAGGFSWKEFFRSIFLLNWAGRHPWLVRGFALFILTILFCVRGFYQHNVALVFFYFGVIVVLSLVAVAAVSLYKTHTPRLQLAGALLVVLIGLPICVFHEDVALWFRYQSLNVVELQEMPETDFDRILPRQVVNTLMRERMNEPEMSTMPDLVRVGKTYGWVSDVEPTNTRRRFLTGNVDEIIYIPSTVAAPDFSRNPKISVDFSVGENMLLGKDVRSCVSRAFGPWRYLNYEPYDVMRMQDDNGKWVQVVSLIHWSGIFFPRPEFGGVQVVQQDEPAESGFFNGATHWLKGLAERTLVGCGRYIPPEDVHKHAFLRGQNLLSEAASRFIARSFRFQDGLYELYVNGKGDVRIPDLPGDANDQPFVIYFKLKQPGVEGEGTLYHYFSLQPKGGGKSGDRGALSVSLFIPADGVGTIYAYRHYRYEDHPTGVSSVATKVQASRKEINWNKNFPIEHRPYVKYIADANGNVKKRLMWLSTVATVRERTHADDPIDFVSGTTPDLVLTDTRTNDSVWVNPSNPEGWPDEIRAKFGKAWATQK